MQKKVLLVFIGLLFFFQGVNAQADTILANTILNRYHKYLLHTLKQEHDINRLISTIGANGQWPDINYADTEKANWKNLIHLKRVRELALAWEKPGAWFHHPGVWKAFNAGLDHWLDERYKNSNWWHNEIGVPQCMRDIIILVKKKLTAAQLKAAMEVMAQHRIQENWVGANLTWSADLGFHYGAITSNAKMMELCRNLIIREIRISTEEGVQPDFSFHQHGPRLQMYQYGRAFLWENIRLAWELRSTPMAFPKEKIDILINFALEGWQWMARGIHTVPGTMDRSASRVNELNSADLIDLVPYLIELSPKNKRAFNELAQIQKGKGSLAGHRYYPYSDFAAFHQKDFSFFLKTISSRTLATESINSENLKGKLLNSGDAYLVRDGREYFNLMPVWDWTHLPGVTAFSGADRINRQAFVGSVSNGEKGLTTMDYQLKSKDEKKSITARKFWAAAGKQVVCLIAGLQDSGIAGAYTTLDQCRWRGDVVVNEEGNKFAGGIHKLNDVSWIHHAGFAYIPLSPSRIDLHLTTVTSSWKEINASETNAPVSEMVFMPVIQHHSLENDATGYVLASCKSPKDAAKMAVDPQWKILRNDKELQSVLFNEGTLMAAFYSEGRLQVPNKKLQISVNHPCLVLVSHDGIWLSSPSGLSINLRLEVNDQIHNVALPADGTSVKL